MIVPVLTVVERKLLGRFQARYGPNRVGPLGLVQPLADIVKLVGKEMFRPAGACRSSTRWPGDRRLQRRGDPGDPALGRYVQEIGSGEVGLYGIDVSIGVLYFFAFGSISFYGLLLGGWASGSKYRSSAPCGRPRS